MSVNVRQYPSPSVLVNDSMLVNVCRCSSMFVNPPRRRWSSHEAVENVLQMPLKCPWNTLEMKNPEMPFHLSSSTTGQNHYRLAWHKFSCTQEAVRSEPFSSIPDEQMDTRALSRQSIKSIAGLMRNKRHRHCVSVEASNTTLWLASLRRPLHSFHINFMRL